jgi:hypothetical protein
MVGIQHGLASTAPGFAFFRQRLHAVQKVTFMAGDQALRHSQGHLQVMIVIISLKADIPE